MKGDIVASAKIKVLKTLLSFATLLSIYSNSGKLLKAEYVRNNIKPLGR